jgi:hypothetical protein
VRLRESGASDRSQQQLPGDPVNRRVNHPQRLRTPGDRDTCRDGVKVGRGDLLAVPRDERVIQAGGGDGEQRAECRDPVLDLAVDRRDDLRAVAQVKLVAVVGPWVMAGGDHDGRLGGQVLDGERGQRRRAWPGQQRDTDARSGEDLGRLIRELRRPVPRVAPDNDPQIPWPRRLAGTRLRRLANRVEQPARYRAGGGAHHGPVHAVGPGTDLPPQPGGAEHQPAREPVR